ncbi:unnamed protein product [Ranitomeya imitator]|uniref:RAWUL domain-containing protein n=1 Tax=Ranitomeya imitator TaxID=111125 RepID=A0ABN9KQ69_9NEOB|nr:unnamed protein product [Ranitomeya imitator]
MVPVSPNEGSEKQILRVDSARKDLPVIKINGKTKEVLEEISSPAIPAATTTAAANTCASSFYKSVTSSRRSGLTGTQVRHLGLKLTAHQRIEIYIATSSKGLFSHARNTSVSRMWKRSSGAGTSERSVRPHSNTWSRTLRSGVPMPELGFHMRDTDIALCVWDRLLPLITVGFSSKQLHYMTSYSTPCKNMDHGSFHDRTMQDIVYKLVPGLQEAEIRKQREFYHKLGMEVPGDIKAEPCAAKQHVETVRNGEAKPEENTTKDATEEKQEEDHDYHRSDEQVSICLECNSSKLRGLKRKWIRCSAQATVLHLKKFIAKKLNLSSFNELDILCNEEILGKDHTLKFVVVTRWRFKYIWSVKNTRKLADMCLLVFHGSSLIGRFKASLSPPKSYMSCGHRHQGLIYSILECFR